MHWNRLAMSSAIALAAALAFYPALRLGRRIRTLVWLFGSAIVGLSLCLMPLDSTTIHRLTAQHRPVGQALRSQSRSSARPAPRPGVVPGLHPQLLLARPPQ